MEMDKNLVREVIAKRVAQEFHDGYVVNLGIGLPTLVANYVGDMDVDVQTAKNSGVDIVYCKWGFGTSNGEENIPEDIKVDTVNEIIVKIMA